VTTTTLALWDPPCYLYIINFEKTGQETTVDDMWTQLTYNIEVHEHGDNACRDNKLTVELPTTGSYEFKHWFSDTHKNMALQPGGFNYTVAI